MLKQDVVVPSEQDIAHHVAHRRLVAESGNGGVDSPARKDFDAEEAQRLFDSFVADLNKQFKNVPSFPETRATFLFECKRGGEAPSRFRPVII